MPETAARTLGSRYRVFIDFDNTITLGDVLDSVIEKFAADRSWIALEEEWAAGRLGARDCLDGQLRCLRAEWPAFARHLDGVVFDAGFRGLVDLLRAEGVELTISTDNFDLFVRHILTRQGFADLPVLANRVELNGDRVIPSFPYYNPDCPGCAHCKKTHFLPPNDDGRLVVYIGDGRSDRCPSRHADIVFAKSGLLTYLQSENIPCLAFGGLADVTAGLRKIFDEHLTR